VEQIDSLVRATVESGNIDRGALLEAGRILLSQRRPGRRGSEQLDLQYNLGVIRALLGEKAAACPSILVVARSGRDAARRQRAQNDYDKLCLSPRGS
jgi:hypothetical protein